MARLLTLLLIVAPATLASATAGDDKKEAVLYYPTRVGDRRVYQDGDKLTTLVVTKVEDRDGAKVVTVASEVDGNFRPGGRVAVSAAGLVLLEQGDGRLDPPLVLLKLPPKP